MSEIVKIILTGAAYMLGIIFLVCLAGGIGIMLFWDVQDHRREREANEREDKERLRYKPNSDLLDMKEGDD